MSPESAVYELSVSVAAVNDAPVAADDTLAASEDTPVTYLAAQLLGNDTDVESDPLTIGSVTSGTGGTAVLNGDGTVSFTPSGNFNGAASFTYTASDGTAPSSPATVTVNVAAVNDAPTITEIADQTIDEDASTGALSFTVGDVETPAAALTVSGSSSNQVIVPDAKIVFGGSDASRTVTVTPVGNHSGTASITVTVSDGGTVPATATFLLTVTAVNDAPTISDITDQVTYKNLATGVITFTVGDAETAPESLLVTGSSSNQTVVPNDAANIVFGESENGVDRAVIITPAPDQIGVATITVTVSDGTVATSGTFVLTVITQNNAPTDITLDNSSVAENEPPGTVVGTFFTTDQDSDDTHTYSLVSGTGSQDNASFTISDNLLKVKTVFDYEINMQPYNIRVRSDDNNWGTYEKSFVITVTDVDGINGDINNDGVVSLSDLILSIQIMNGQSPLSTINLESDVNGDNKIGLPEAIYILQTIAELRP